MGEAIEAIEGEEPIFVVMRDDGTITIIAIGEFRIKPHQVRALISALEQAAVRISLKETNEFIERAMSGDAR